MQKILLLQNENGSTVWKAAGIMRLHGKHQENVFPDFDLGIRLLLPSLGCTKFRHK